MARKARVIIRVVWNPGEKTWNLLRKGFVRSQYPTRQEAVKTGAHWGRQVWHGGTPAQLVVQNKGNGRISFERTYGRDPRRYKG